MAVGSGVAVAGSDVGDGALSVPVEPAGNVGADVALDISAVETAAVAEVDVDVDEGVSLQPASATITTLNTRQYLVRFIPALIFSPALGPFTQPQLSMRIA
jgi:hypothetical protein